MTKDEAVVNENTSEQTAEAVTEEIDETAKKIAELEEELNSQKDKYLRLCAEYDNYRKRTANEKLSIYDDATAKAVTELLPVADSIQMAITNLKDCDPEILKGIELISNQLAKSLEKLKVEPFGAQGEEFNPKFTTQSQRLTMRILKRTVFHRCSRQVTKSVIKLFVMQWFRLQIATKTFI